MTYLLAIDQGTTGSTSLLIDAKTLTILDKEKSDYRQIYPTPGWVEHDLEDIWNSVALSVQTILKRTNVNPKDIAAIGITNQRETTCAYDKKGRPLHHAIVWQDRRTASFCEEHAAKYNFLFRKKNRLPRYPNF